LSEEETFHSNLYILKCAFSIDSDSTEAMQGYTMLELLCKRLHAWFITSMTLQKCK